MQAVEVDRPVVVVVVVGVVDELDDGGETGGLVDLVVGAHLVLCCAVM